MNSVLPAVWKVPEVFRSRLGEQAGRQRMMATDGHLLLILHELPEPGNPDRVPVFFWRDNSGAWRSNKSGSGLAELQALLRAYAETVDKLEAKIQQPPSAQNFFDILHASVPLLRSARNMHSALQASREAIPQDRHLLISRDQAGELERALELLNSDAKNGLEYMIARQAEEQSRNSEELVLSSYRLNLLVAMFLPLTALGSAFGMNFKHGLEKVESPLLFWGVLVAGIVVGFLVKAGISAKSISVKR